MTDREPTEENTRPSKLLSEPAHLTGKAKADFEADAKALHEKAAALYREIDCYVGKVHPLDTEAYAKLAAARSAVGVAVTWFESHLGLKKAA
jgi:hypothetical protein